MLSNAYFLTKFRFDTAEDEPAKNLHKLCKNSFKIANFANFAPVRVDSVDELVPPAPDGRNAARGPPAAALPLHRLARGEDAPAGRVPGRDHELLDDVFGCPPRRGAEGLPPLFFLTFF